MANMIKNNEAVSPIVATLILIVVAIVAAAAVMLFMNSYNDKVSNTANDQTDAIIGQMGTSSGAISGSIKVSGSTTCAPSVSTVANAFMALHDGVTISVAATGSGQGYADIQNGACDIGMSSRSTTKTDFESASNIQVDQIGVRGVVFIFGNGTTGTHVTVAKTVLDDYFDAGTALPAGTTVATRSDLSGTAEAVADYFGFADKDKLTCEVYSTTKTGKQGYLGNAGVYNAVKAGTSANKVYGYCDFGYYNAADPIRLVNIDEGVNGVFIPTASNILNENNKILGRTTGGVDTYASKLCGGLFIMYNKDATSPVTNFVTYLESQTASQYFDQNGVWSMYDL